MTRTPWPRLRGRFASGRSRRAALLTTALIAGAGLLGGCGGAAAETNAPASASASASQGQTLNLIVELTSADNTLHTVGPEGAQIYGRNNLVGQTEVDGETVQVELLGNVDYTNGRGPFDGFLTLTFPDAAAGPGGTDAQGTPEDQGETPAPSVSGSSVPGQPGDPSAGGAPSPSGSGVSLLGTRVDGEATPVDSGTKFAARLEVIGGTGRFANTVGAGSFSGSRAEGVGGAVRLDITLVLDDTTG